MPMDRFTCRKTYGWSVMSSTLNEPKLFNCTRIGTLERSFDDAGVGPSGHDLAALGPCPRLFRKCTSQVSDFTG